jgi:hypothetical protein
MSRSGTSGVRPAEEMPGCVGGPPDENPETALFRIGIIQVPLAAPENATIVNAPRIFADAETDEHLTENELAAAELVQRDRFNAQTQRSFDWPADPVVAHALLDQLARGSSVPASRVDAMRAELNRISELSGGQRRDRFTGTAEEVAALAGAAVARSADAERLHLLAETLGERAGS